jgi:hypothetical protein
VESFYTCNGEYITWSLALFDKIKSELTIDKEKTSTYIPRLKKSPDDKISSITHGYIGVTMVSLVIMSIIVGDIPIVVAYLKKCLDFRKNNVWTEKNKNMVTTIN